MFCAVFIALLGSALAGPIDFEADLKHNVDLGGLQKERLKDPSAVEAEIELLKAAYAKTVIEPPAPLNEPAIEDEDTDESNKKADDDYLVEGDILLSNEQRALIENESNRSRRQALKDEGRSWGSVNPVIPYYYNATFPKETRSPIITAAMKFWEKNTCVRFKEADSGYRMEIRDWEGCSSNLGKTNSDTGIQYLNIGKGCMQLGIITHELMHTFGFMHTQERFDRDKYIDIDFENVKTDGIYNTVSAQEYVLHDIPYEFGSVMHYDHLDFSKEDQPAIYAKLPYKVYQRGMSGRMPTFYDILAVNRHFNCTAKCEISVKCANGGVQDVNNCNKCLCPIGWTGDDCSERPINTNHIAVTKEFMTKTISINSTMPSTTEYNVTYYMFKAPAGMNIQMTPKVLTRRYRDKSCMDMGIEVKFLRDQRPAGLQVCNMDDKYPTITSETNVMFVQAYTLGREFDVELQFKAVKPAEKCKTSVACANSGVQDVNNCHKCLCPIGWIGDKCEERPKLKEMLFANSTPETIRIEMDVGTNSTEYYLITAPPGMKVQMIPEVLAASEDSSCSSMGIEVKYLKDQRPAGFRVCDWQEKPTITSETNEMFVQAYTLGEQLAAELQFKAVKFAEKCKTSVECFNGGVQDVNICIKCRCPPGWIGDTCDKRPEHTKLFAKSKVENVTIGMPVGTNTTQHRVEYYMIKAPTGMKIQMTPRVLNAEYSKPCDDMGIKVEFVRNQRPAGIRVCPSTEPPTITSETNEMLMQVYTLEDEFAAELQFKAVK